MSEVEKFKCIGYMVGRSRLGGAEYVRLSDFDRVTAERDALQALLTASDVLEGLLREAAKTPWLYDVRGKIMASLKPTEPAKCERCGCSTVETYDDRGCGYLGAGNGAPE